MSKPTDISVGSGKVQLAASLVAFSFLEKIQINSIAQNLDAKIRWTKRTGALRKRTRHCHESSTAFERIADQKPRNSVIGNKMQIAAACRDDDRLAQFGAEPSRGDPVGIYIMRVDQIVSFAVFESTAHMTSQ